METINKIISRARQWLQTWDPDPVAVTVWILCLGLAVIIPIAVTRIGKLKAEIELLKSAPQNFRLVGPIDTVLLAQPWESCTDLDGRLPAGNGQAGYIYAFPATEEK